jgi:hypothetical protein
MSPKVQRVCVWGGPALMGLVFAGLIAAHWFPPPAPSDSAVDTARQYQQHTTGIRIGALLIAAAGTALGPFSATLTAQMKRIEGRGAVLAYLQLCMGALWITGILIPASLWMAAAFDPDRDPEITRALHVAGWLPFVAMVFPLIAAHLSVAAATLGDQRSVPVFARWVGYLNLWMAVLLAPGVLVLFFKTGPFAWNGIFTFWLAASAETAYFLTMFVMLRRAIAQQEAEDADVINH